MNSATRINIAAPYARIFELAANVERWPEILPHYRYVRPVPAGEGERRFAMGASRGSIPVSWEAIQRPMPDARRIEFEHTGGVTKGMKVAWIFEPVANFAGEAWNVRIEHELDLDWPLIGGLVADQVIGPHFIDAIAGRTLRTIRDLAERGA